MIKLLGTASADYEKSLNMTFLTEAFKNQVNLDTLLCSSSLFEHAGSKSSHPAPTPSEQQLSAKMHVFYGRSVEPLLDADDENARARRVHPYARSRVYDLRRYNDYNEWGPFLDDGTCSIDWEKVQCIMTVLLYNLRALNERSTYHQRGSRQWPERRNNPFDGTAPYSFVPIPTPCPAHEAAKVKEPVPDLAAEDPYGVTGTWRRIVCFLDYTDLYAFNFEGARLPLPEERPPIDTQEAIRIITLKIRVTAVSPPGEDDHPDWPVVSFNGTSRSMHTSWDPNANSKIRGTVRTTKEGEVRWTSFSIYHGEERWRSEGVQIGGLRSGRGIIGTWFDKDYDVHGPAGPTAFWKTSDDVEVCPLNNLAGEARSNMPLPSYLLTSP